MKFTVPLVVVASLAAGCTASSPQAAADAPPIVVSIARAESVDLASSFEAGGVVRAKSTAAIASRIMAPIVEIHVRPGDRVRRNAPLVTLDAREITANRTRAAAGLASAVEGLRAAEAETRAAEASAALAGLTHDRMRALQATRSATPQELDQAVAALGVAEAQVNSARARVAAANAAREAAQAAMDAATITTSYATLTAPFDGVITDRSVDPGSMANPGASLLTLEDPTSFRLEVSLDEARARQIALGDPVAVAIGESANRPVTGRVVEIARVDSDSHSFVVKLDLPADPAVRSGLFGRARFSGPSRRALAVPDSAVVRRGQLAFVFAIDQDNRARLQPVSAGAATGDRVEMLAGVRDGDRVITNPPASLSDGVRVTGARP